MFKKLCMTFIFLIGIGQTCMPMASSQQDMQKQMQEMQEYFNSLPPEELERLMQEADQMWNSMSEAEQQEIMRFAEEISPYFDAENPSQYPDMSSQYDPSTDYTSSVPAEQPIDTHVDTSATKQLLLSFSKNLESLLLKLRSGSKDIQELVQKKLHTSDIRMLQQSLLELQDETMLQSLLIDKKSASSSTEKGVAPFDKEDTDSFDKEDQEHGAEDQVTGWSTDQKKVLLNTLETIYHELISYNERFVIGDSFGLSEPVYKEQQAREYAIATEVVSFLNNTATQLHDALKTFLATEITTTHKVLSEKADKKTQAAKTHAKDSELDRKSYPAYSEDSGRTYYDASEYETPSYYGSSYNQPYSSGQSYQPSYGNDYNSYDYGSNWGGGNSGSDFSSPTAKPSSQKPTPEKKKDDKKKDDEDDKDKDKKKDTKQQMQKIEEDIEDFNETYKQKQAALKEFLERDILHYPMATGADKSSATNPDLQLQWLTSTGNYTHKGMQFYIDTVQQAIQTYQAMVLEASKILESTRAGINNLQLEEIKKLEQNKALKKIEQQFSDYKQALDKAFVEIEKKRQENTDPQKSMLWTEGTAGHSERYTTMHESMMQKLREFRNKIDDVITASRVVKSKLQRFEKKRKATSKKTK